MSDEAPRANLTLELAHVLFMDIVGYSQLSMGEQEKQLRTLQDSVRLTREFVDAEATSQLICLPTGDGMALVFFGDPEAPARCAVHLDQLVRSGSPAIRLRMGLHSGPVYRVADINANRNVAGGGINIAQRVMDCGDAGQATGELEKANQTYELWLQVYPRDDTARGNLGANYSTLGQYEKAAIETRESLRLEPNSVVGYSNLSGIYAAMNRFDEARTTIEEALARNLDDIELHLNLYDLAFVQGDVPAMKQQADWAIGKPGAEDQMLSLESDTEAWSGRLGKARELSRQAVETARRGDEKEPAALWQANAAIREALFGNADVARQNAAAAVALAPGSHDAEAQAALAYALAGDTAHAQSLADDLTKRFPQDTVVQSVWLPTIRAQIEMGRKNPARSIELLQVEAPYELSGVGGAVPVYVHAEAYLSAHQGGEAAVEFQKILDHRGVVSNQPIGALARLGLAHAYAMQGDSAKARVAYQDSLTLWKDADDIPILKEAKAEYAKLK